jgi:hypothetical protein
VSGFKPTNIAATTAAVTNRIVTTTNMIVGAYAIANASPVWAGGCLITATVTAGDTADTMGTLVIVGKDLWGNALTETLTPIAGSTVTGSKVFRSVTTATGVGWVKDIVEATNDTIVVGVAAGSYVATGGGLLRAVDINTTAAAAVTISDASGTLSTLASNIAVGAYNFDIPWSGFLKVATTSTNDVTLIHSPGVPSVYAMS